MAHELALDLLRHGYRALPTLRARAGGRRVVRTRLLGRRALVVSGRDAARRFYDADLICRHGAVPAVLGGLLFGRGAVHGLDGAEHQQRKELFLDLLDGGAVELAERVGELLRHRLEDERCGSPRVFDLLVETYSAAVLDWAGIEVEDPAELGHRLVRIVDGFGGARTAYLRAWAARLSADRWARRQIRQARRGAGGGSRVVDRVAQWRSLEGGLLSERVAAVELLNLLRPAVAVAFLGVPAVEALDADASARTRLAEPGRHAARRAFVHEVRRQALFVPALAGRVRCATTWGDEQLGRGHRVVLDVPGTNHDADVWPAPDRFDPTRFIDRDIDQFDLVPQGGGDPATGHRCPGEPATVAMLMATVEAFAAAPWRVVERGRDPERIPPRDRLRVLLT